MPSPVWDTGLAIPNANETPYSQQVDLTSALLECDLPWAGSVER
jgi:hypothetical protein